VQLVFSHPHFTWTENGRVERGVFSLYETAGKTVLTLKGVNDSGLITQTRTFEVEQADQPTASGQEPKTGLVLYPAKTSSNGVERLDFDPYHFETMK
jgi:hypothetical protein